MYSSTDEAVLDIYENRYFQLKNIDTARFSCFQTIKVTQYFQLIPSKGLSLIESHFLSSLRLVPLTPANALILDRDFRCFKRTDAFNRAVDYLLNRDEELKKVKSYPVPEELRLSPHAYQLKGSSEILRRERCILAWPVGTGKTLTSVLATLQSGVKNCLIVCPASLKRTVWELELSKLQAKSVKVVDGLKDFNNKTFWTVASYDMVRLCEGNIPHFDAIICDESSQLKNQDTRTFQSLSTLSQQSLSILLNGTPIENNIKELQAQIQFLYPEITDESLHSLFNHGEESTRVERIKRFISDFVVTPPEGIATSLPAKERVERLKMHPLQKKYYDQMRSSILEVPTFERLIRLQQLCDDPGLVGVEMKSSPKIDRIKILSNQFSKAIYFTQYREMALRLANEFKNFVVFHGTMNDKERVRAIEQFLHNPKVRGFIMTEAGAKGLNLPNAKAVVFVDGLWNPAKMNQIIGRAQRPATGQTNSIQVIHLIMSNSVEEYKIGVRDGKSVIADFVRQALNKKEDGDYLKDLVK